MNTYRTVVSVCNGTIDKVCVNEGAHVHEWEPLFLLKTNEGVLKKVGFTFFSALGVGGDIFSLNVKQGDRVSHDMTLAILKEDYLPSGCD